jgi:hypothetical protein
MSLLTAILSPAFLVNRIGTLSFIIAAAMLIIFSDRVMTYIVFPVSDWIRDKTSLKLVDFKNTHRMRLFAKYFSESLACLLFLIYCWMGTDLLSEYIISPILFKWKGFILITILVCFFLISYAINNEKMRKALFECWKHRQ